MYEVEQCICVVENTEERRSFLRLRGVIVLPWESSKTYDLASVDPAIAAWSYCSPFPVFRYPFVVFCLGTFREAS